MSSPTTHSPGGNLPDKALPPHSLRLGRRGCLMFGCIQEEGGAAGHSLRGGVGEQGPP